MSARPPRPVRRLESAAPPSRSRHPTRPAARTHHHRRDDGFCGFRRRKLRKRPPPELVLAGPRV